MTFPVRRNITLQVPLKGVTVCATGMGAYIHQASVKDATPDVDYGTFDEFTTMINGLRYLVNNCPNEVYHLTNPYAGEHSAKTYLTGAVVAYPYAVVTVGSATSIQLIESPTKHSVVGGSNVGGGTFLGLACLLTHATTFEEVLELARRGQNKGTVDKVVSHLTSRLTFLLSFLCLNFSFVFLIYIS